jgi:hypothetical protein
MVRRTDRKMQLLEVWEFWEVFVRDLYPNLELMEICEFRAILEW